MSNKENNKNKDQLSFEFGPYPEKTTDDPYKIDDKKKAMEIQGYVDITQGEFDSYFREHGKRILDTSEEISEPRKKKMSPFDILNKRLYKGNKSKTKTSKPRISVTATKKAVTSKEEFDLLAFMKRNLNTFAAPDRIEELKSISEFLQSSPFYYNVIDLDNDLLVDNPVLLDYKTLINYLSEYDRMDLLDFVNDLLKNFYDENDFKDISDFNNYKDD